MNQFQQIRVGQLGWRGVLGLIVASAAGVAVLLLLLGLALALIPVIAIAVIVGRWRLQAMQRAAVEAAENERRRADQAAGIIDGDFTIIERDAPQIR